MMRGSACCSKPAIKRSFILLEALKPNQQQTHGLDAATENVRRYTRTKTFNNSVVRAHFRQIFDQDRCSQPADIKGLFHHGPTDRISLIT